MKLVTEEKIAACKTVPKQIKSAWLNTSCWAGEDGIPRLRIVLEINGAPYETLLDTLVSDCGVISQSNNLTWILGTEIHTDETKGTPK